MKARSRSGTAARLARVDDRPVVGWREWIALPTLLVDHVKAKIDSGARTSAIHAFSIKTFTDHGAPHVSFVVHPVQRRRQPAVTCVAEIRDEREVMSSNGHRERRYVIEVDACLGGFTWPIELTLADRDPLGFRVLLGRQALRDRFLVDPNRSFIAGRSFADVSTISTNKR